MMSDTGVEVFGGTPDEMLVSAGNASGIADKCLKSDGGLKGAPVTYRGQHWECPYEGHGYNLRSH